MPSTKPKRARLQLCGDLAQYARGITGSGSFGVSGFVVDAIHKTQACAPAAVRRPRPARAPRPGQKARLPPLPLIAARPPTRAAPPEIAPAPASTKPRRQPSPVLSEARQRSAYVVLLFDQGKYINSNHAFPVNSSCCPDHGIGSCAAMECWLSSRSASASGRSYLPGFFCISNQLKNQRRSQRRAPSTVACRWQTGASLCGGEVLQEGRCGERVGGGARMQLAAAAQARVHARYDLVPTVSPRLRLVSGNP